MWQHSPSDEKHSFSCEVANINVSPSETETTTIELPFLSGGFRGGFLLAARPHPPSETNLSGGLRGSFDMAFDTEK